jgi:hypothetical protein
MITNLEIDDSLAEQIESAAKAQGISTREFIRLAVRQALENPSHIVVPPPFVQRVHDFGAYIESPWTILVDIESDEYIRKNTRK